MTDISLHQLAENLEQQCDAFAKEVVAQLHPALTALHAKDEIAAARCLSGFVTWLLEPRGKKGSTTTQPGKHAPQSFACPHCGKTITLGP